MKTPVPGEICGVKVIVADTFFRRLRGLIGRAGLPKGAGMLITRCRSIHTLFMRFAIDAVFLDADFEPVKRVDRIPPWRFCVWGGPRARHVLEVQSGTFAGRAISS